MATSPLVPGRFAVAIEDHPYQIDAANFRRATVPVLRQQADQSSEPGEASLNPAGLWRRSQESWHHGAGQDFLDGKSEEAADPHRFRSSKGIDPWTRGQISLLHPTLKAWSSANSNLFLTVSHITDTSTSVLHMSDGTEVYFALIPYGGINSLALQQGTGWTPTNATIASTATGRFTLTATANAAVSATSPAGTAGMPVDGGRRYTAYFMSQYSSGGAPKTARVSVNWYDSGGTLISSTAAVTSATNDASTSSVTDTPTAPSNAAYASLTISYTANWVVGEVHIVRAANLMPFDATTPVGAVDDWSTSIINAGQPAATVQSLASDGTYVWAALGTSGLHRTTGPSTMGTVADVPAAPAGGQISLVGYANGFLLAAGSAGVSTTRKNSLWVVNDPLGTPALSLIKTHPNPSFQWTFITSGRSCVYAGGNSGGNGEIYKITFDPNTGTLSSAASAASFLPDGETIHALQFYAGGIIMGTGRGLRVGQADGAGNIDYGPLIETEWPVRCLEPQGRYCWFGWTKYDESTSGLGRADLGFFTDTLTPAYASDLMTNDTSTGDVVSAVTFSPYGYTSSQRPPVRVFTVAGEGVYIEDAYSRVSASSLYTGTVRFSTSEPKTLRSLDVRHHALPAGSSVQPLISRDGNDQSWQGLLPSNTAGSYGATLTVTGDAAESFEIWFGLGRPTPAGDDFTQTPEMTRWTMKALAQPSTIDETFTIPLILRDPVEDLNGSAYPVDVDAEIAYLKGLERNRTLVTLQVGTEQMTVYIAASEFAGQNVTRGRETLAGVYTIQAQTVRG